MILAMSRGSSIVARSIVLDDWKRVPDIMPAYLERSVLRVHQRANKRGTHSVTQAGYVSDLVHDEWMVVLLRRDPYEDREKPGLTERSRHRTIEPQARCFCTAICRRVRELSGYSSSVTCPWLPE